MQNYDVVIKAHPKDYYKLPYVVDSLKHLKPTFENIYLVSPDGFLPECNFSDKIIAIKDEDVKPFIDKTKFSYRYNWAWVNLLSITQEFTKNNLYFDVQSDNVFINDIDLFDEEGKPKLFRTKVNMANNQEWAPYFNFSRAMFGLGKATIGSSFIIEFMLYDKKKLSKLYENFESKQLMIEQAYKNVSKSSYPADQEIYGNFIEINYPEDYNIVGPVETYMTGKFSEYDELEEFLQYIEEIRIKYPNALACSYHTYWMPDE